jgi:hypothetical protein
VFRSGNPYQAQREDDGELGTEVSLDEIMALPRRLSQDDNACISEILGVYSSQYPRSYFIIADEVGADKCQVLLNYQLIKEIQMILKTGQYAFIGQKPEGEYAQRLITAVDPADVEDPKTSQ